MRVNLNPESKAYISRDRLIGEVEKLLDSLLGDQAMFVTWIDVPIVRDDTVRKWTAVFFLTDNTSHIAFAIASNGFKVVN